MSRTAITVEIGNAADAYLDEATSAVRPGSLILHTGSVELALTFASDAGSAVYRRIGQALVDWADSLTEMSLS